MSGIKYAPVSAMPRQGNWPIREANAVGVAETGVKRYISFALAFGGLEFIL